jgi:hypothetical protein
MAKRKTASTAYSRQFYRALQQAAKLADTADEGDDTLARDICFLLARLADGYKLADDCTELPDLLSGIYPAIDEHGQR